MNSTPHQNRGSKKQLYIVASIVLVAMFIGGYFVAAHSLSYWPFNNSSFDKNGDSQVVLDDMNQSDLTYSTDKNQTNSDKVNNDQQETNSSDEKTVQIAITHASVVDNAVEVRAFISGVIEGTGVCVAELKKSDLFIQKTSKAFIDARTSQCEPINIPLSEFTQKGTWSLVVRYSSPTSSGTSESMEVTL